MDEDSGAIDVSKLRRQLQSMSEVPMEFLLLLDGQRRVLFANSAFCSYRSVDLNRLRNSPFCDLFNNEGQIVENVLRRVAHPPHEEEFKQLMESRADQKRILRWKFTGVPDDQGVIDRIMVTGRDMISEQVSEHLITEQDRQLRTVMANLPGMVYRCRNDELMTLEFVSDGCLVLTGYTSGELIEGRRKSYSELIHPQDMDTVRREMNAAIEEKRPYQVTYRLIRRDGMQIWVREQGCAVYKQSGRVRYLEGIIVDVSRELILAEQLRHAQKMEAIGQLAGGVAHDFNNLLQVILSYTELLAENKSQSAENQANIDHIYKASLRARDLVQQLLAFGRRQLLEPVCLNLNELVEKMTRMLPRVLGEKVSLTFTGARKPYFILADPGAIEQVIMNLCLNARDAMPEGGDIVITLEDGPAPEAEGKTTGQFVTISVKDSGVGIAPEMMEHLFEPFFTTKNVGEGTGLGLATVYGIVKQHKGEVLVQSEPGKGATFMVQLERCAPPLGESASQDDARAAEQGPGKVLVVEDDGMVLQLLSNVLRRIGVLSDTAGTFADAVQLLKQNSWEYDLVISDLGLPDGKGSDLLAQVRFNNSRARLLLMSGYLDELDVRDDLYYLIRKPFSIKMLKERVVELLGSGI